MEKKEKPKIQEADVEKRGLALFARMRNYQEPKVRRWRAENDQYYGNFSEKERKVSEVLGKPLLFIRKTYTHVQRYLIEVLDQIFFDPEEVAQVKSWKGVPHWICTVVKSVVNYILDGHPIKFYGVAYESALDAIRNHIGIIKVYPKKDYKTGEVTYCMEALPYEDVYFHPRATWVDYSAWPHCHRFVRTKEYFQKAGYQNIERCEQSIAQSGDGIAEQRTSSSDSGMGEQEIDGLKEFVGYEFWDFLDIDGDGHLESVRYCMLGDINGPKVLSKPPEKNELPYDGESPIVVGEAFPESHTLEGKSLTWRVEDLQKETNAIRNQRRELVALKMRQPILLQRGSGIDVYGLANRGMAKIIQGDDISEAAVRELKVDDVSQGSAQEMAITDKDFYEADSVTPEQLGVKGNDEETATAVERRNANAGKMIGHVVRNLRYTLYQPSLARLLRLVQHFASDKYLAMVTNKTLGWGLPEDGVPMKEMIGKDMDLTIDLGVNKQIQLNKIFLLIDRGNQANATLMQMVQAGVVNPATVKFWDTSKLFEDAMATMGRKNIAEYQLQALPPPPGAEGGGVASQPAAPVDNVLAPVSNMNPEGTSGTL